MLEQLAELLAGWRAGYLSSLPAKPRKAAFILGGEVGGGVNVAKAAWQDLGF